MKIRPDEAKRLDISMLKWEMQQNNSMRRRLIHIHMNYMYPQLALDHIHLFFVIHVWIEFPNAPRQIHPAALFRQDARTVGTPIATAHAYNLSAIY